MMNHRRWLLGILLLAAALRFYALDGQSLWADEGNSAALASRSLSQIARAAAQDIHPPLYYWLLHGWTFLFGTSETGLRSLSATLGVLLVALTYQVGRDLLGGRAALAAAFVAAIAPFQIYYAQEARMYMLLACLGAGAAWGLQKASLRPRAGFSAYVVCAVLGLYTHYAFPFLLLAINLAFGFWLVTRRHGPRSLRPLAAWGAAHGAVLILYLPWLPTAWQRVTAWPGPTDVLPLTDALPLALGWLYFGPATRAVHPAWLRLLPTALACLGLLGRRGPGEEAAGWPRRAYLLLWLLLPVLLLLASGAFREANLKFLLMSGPALCLLLGRLMAGWDASIPGLNGARSVRLLRLGWFILILGVLAAPTLQALHGYYTDPRLARDDYRGVARYIAAVARPGDAVVLNAPGQVEAFGYYDRSGLPVYPLPRQRPPDRAATEAELEQIARRHSRLFVLFWATNESDPARIVETWLDTHAFKALDAWQGNVRFVTYGLGAGTHRVRWETPPRWGDPPLVALFAAETDTEASAGEIVRVLLRWQALRSLPDRYKVTAQLLDARDQVIAQHDAEPAGNSRPTDGWRAGEEVADPHGLFVRPGTPPGDYRLVLALYRADTGARLPLEEGGDSIVLGHVRITKPAEPPPLAALTMQRPRPADFGPVRLLGYDRYKRGFAHAPQTPLRAGDLLHLTFYWQAQAAPARDWRFRLELLDGRGRVVAELASPLVSEDYPTSRWQAGELVRGEHDLPLPAALAPGRYRLRLTLLSGDGEAAKAIWLDALELL
jgi:mannosyltransferase